MLKIVNDRYYVVDLYDIELYCFCIIMIVCLKLIDLLSVDCNMDKNVYIFNIEFCIDISRLIELEKIKILEE